MALACAGIPAGDLMMTGFCDDAEIPTWAKGSAVSALQCGLIRGVGTEGGMAFCADEGVTLSEAATVLNRLLRVTDVGSFRLRRGQRRRVERTGGGES